MNKNQDNNPNNNEKNPFSLPENYFSSFSQKMMLKIEVAEELKEFKLLSSIDKKSPFITPDNYFTQTPLATEIKVEIANYEKLVSLKKTNAFSTPELFFETSAAKIENKIECSEELEMYPALKAVERANAFSLPQDYFDTFSYKVREAISAEKNKAGIFDNVIHLVFSKRTVYALAAMLVLSLGLYFYDSKETVNTGDCNTLACLDRKDILKDNQLLRIDDESLMEIVNPESLSKNLRDNLSGSSKEKNSDKKEKEDYVLENIDVNDITDEI